jgi:peptidoglycan/LPS O-acetylase OafA/YrhL
VVLTTLLTFAVGSVLALAARRSRRWRRVVMAAAAVFAVVSAGGPLSAVHDTATGALLATMHLLTGAVFVATAARAVPRVGDGAKTTDPVSYTLGVAKLASFVIKAGRGVSGQCLTLTLRQLLTSWG